MNILLGSLTTDILGEGDVLTNGGIANVARNLEQEALIIPLEHRIVDIFESLSLTRSKADIDFDLKNIPNVHWIHVCYLDWIYLTGKEVKMLKSKCNILTGDIVNNEPSTSQLFDLIFSNTPIQNCNYFYHTHDEWKIKYEKESTYTPLKRELKYTLGAGDTLVASVMNNVNRLEDIHDYVQKIESGLLPKLIERNDWFSKHL